MGRRPAAAKTADATPVEKPAVRQRRRRTVVDHAAQTQILASSLLKARGKEGAHLNEVQSVVTWARGVYAEGAELKTLATRVRKVRGEDVAGRQAAYEVNKALLDGVLAGTMTVNVNDAGSLVFGDPNATPTDYEQLTND